MCIIVYKPKGATISPDTLKACYMNNADGAGFMYPCENHLLIKKGFFIYADFLTAWEKTHKVHGDSLPVVFHFRISTSGRIDKTNCHPHRIAPDLAFVHNGMLSCVRPSRKSRVSDTIMYRDRFLAKLTGKALRRPELFKEIGDHIGPGNKFVFMNGKGKVAICNETQGAWNNGIWFSNTSYQRVFRHAFPFPFQSECCDYCGEELTAPEEVAYGVCSDCLQLHDDVCMECGGCGEPLTTSAHRAAGWCDFCGPSIYGDNWEKMLREMPLSPEEHDEPF